MQSFEINPSIVSFVMLSVIMLSVIMLSDIMLSVIMLSVQSQYVFFDTFDTFHFTTFVKEKHTISMTTLDAKSC
jgi:hypothetical protein